MKKEIKNQKERIKFEKRSSKQAILNVHHEEGEGKVPIPGLDNVIEAKEWVDEVQK